MASKQADIPYCTVFLVVSCLLCHTLVLVGNLETSGALQKAGSSTVGWSNVGLGLAGSLQNELDENVTSVATVIADGLDQIMKTKRRIDEVVALIGNTTDSFNAPTNPALLNMLDELGHLGTQHDEELDTGLLQKVTHLGDLDPPSVLPYVETVLDDEMSRTQVETLVSLKKDLPFKFNKEMPLDEDDLNDEFRELKVAIRKLVKMVSAELRKLLEVMTPALVQTGKWMDSFSGEVQDGLEGFTQTIDKVQQLFNQMMEHFAPAPANEEGMIMNTFAIFDHDGKVSAESLQKTSEMYGITSVRGSKAKALVEKYDEDNDGVIDKKEWSRLVHDADIPKFMPVVLREYAKRLAEIGGNVAAARARDEVATAVVDYLDLVCAKNISKVRWVSDRLTNGSLPIEFTADILSQLALNVDDPEKKDHAPFVAKLVIGEMVAADAKYVHQAVEKISDPQFWEQEGFKAHDQPTVVDRVLEWIEQTNSKGVSLIDRAAILSGVQARAKSYRAHKRLSHQQRQEQLMASRSSRSLFSTLLGGRTASGTAAGTDDPDALAAVKSSVHAAEETLQFAQWLNNNASQNAQIFQDDCFSYTSESSNQMNSFANQVKGMTKKLTNTLKLMEEFASKKGIERISKAIDSFEEHGANDVFTALNITKQIPVAELIQEPDIGVKQKAGKATQEILAKLRKSDVWAKTLALLDAMEAALPSVTKTMKDSRRQVSAVSSSLNKIFSVFKEKGNPIFENVSSLYKMVSVIYFLLFAVMTIGILIYAFWATGWLGGPKEREDAGEDEAYVPPVGLVSRCCACCRSCLCCFSGCSDSGMCFWACLLFMEFVVLLMFIISLALCLLAGLKAFLGAGCAQIFILGDARICQGAMGLMQRFLSTFQVGDSVFESACTDQHLLTCNLISAEMKKSVIYTTVFSFLGALLSFQMLIEAGVLHERARWLRAIDARTKEP